jgi:hypothetical protein
MIRPELPTPLAVVRNHLLPVMAGWHRGGIYLPVMLMLWLRPADLTTVLSANRRVTQMANAGRSRHAVDQHTTKAELQGFYRRRRRSWIHFQPHLSLEVFGTAAMAQCGPCLAEQRATCGAAAANAASQQLTSDGNDAITARVCYRWRHHRQDLRDGKVSLSNQMTLSRASRRC